MPGQAASEGATPMSSWLYRYEDILRAVGKFIDTHDLQDVVILQTEQGILLRGYRRPSARDPRPDSFVEKLFSMDEIAAIHEQSKRLRGTGSKLFQ